MLPSDEFVRLRTEQLSVEAEQHRLKRHVVAGRWWRCLADFASRRAERARAR